ncbi:MAG: tRNA-2-methylthio-N6-dimethylallyladenosine synthase, partial [Pseudonocardiales bacterium]|nr:tRNA-2-methylthio-N6-dimethylallyladenosine synthase [Pseudonocardiales bacterium]
ISWQENKRLVGVEVQVLVSSAQGKKDAANLRMSGRARDGRLVHVGTGELPVAAGDLVTATVSYAAPHHLVADGGISAHQKWRGALGQPAPTAQPAKPLLSIGRRPAQEV